MVRDHCCLHSSRPQFFLSPHLCPRRYHGQAGATRAAPATRAVGVAVDVAAKDQNASWRRRLIFVDVHYEDVAGAVAGAARGVQGSTYEAAATEGMTTRAQNKGLKLLSRDLHGGGVFAVASVLVSEALDSRPALPPDPKFKSSTTTHQIKKAAWTCIF